MKYIKSYEENKIKPYDSSPYNLDDYVLLDKTKYNPGMLTSAKLIDVAEDNNLFYWVSKLPSGKLVYSADWMILRKLTPEEIVEYHEDIIKVKGNKYNL
jgi:hypothetical protein